MSLNFNGLTLAEVERLFIEYLKANCTEEELEELVDREYSIFEIAYAEKLSTVIED